MYVGCGAYDVDGVVDVVAVCVVIGGVVFSSVVSVVPSLLLLVLSLLVLMDMVLLRLLVLVIAMLLLLLVWFMLVVRRVLWLYVLLLLVVMLSRWLFHRDDYIDVVGVVGGRWGGVGVADCVGYVVVVVTAFVHCVARDVIVGSGCCVGLCWCSWCCLLCG